MLGSYGWGGRRDRKVRNARPMGTVWTRYTIHGSCQTLEMAENRAFQGKRILTFFPGCKIPRQPKNQPLLSFIFRSAAQ
jgi:hypothetical protein